MKDSNFGFIRMRAPACEKPLELRGKEFLVPQWIVGLVPLPLIYRDTVAQSCWESVCSYKRNLYAKCECLSKTCCMWNVLFQRVHSIVYPLISFRVERSERERPTLVRAISSSSLKNSATFLQVSKKWHEMIYSFRLFFSFFPFFRLLSFESIQTLENRGLMFFQTTSSKRQWAFVKTISLLIWVWACRSIYVWMILTMLENVYDI